MRKSKLNFRGLFDRVHYVMKTRQDNDVIDCMGSLYTENNTELLWLIILSNVCDKNKAWQRCDQLYRYGLRWKW